MANTPRLELSVLIVFALIGLGNSVSMPRAPGMFLRLTNGSEVSVQDYGANSMGAGAVGVITNGTDFYCVGVLTSFTQFVTYCSGNYTHVFVGSRYHPTFANGSYFDGQVLNVIGGPTNDPDGYVFFQFEVTRLPVGSKAVPALVYPEGTPPPGPGTQCVVYGYSGPGTPFVLNTRHAIITDAATCNATYPEDYDPQIAFCATVGDANGSSAICKGDRATVVMCLGWNGWNYRSEQLDKDIRLSGFCLFNSQSPLCHWLCAWNPYYCITKEDQAWYLAGIQIANNNTLHSNLPFLV